MKQEMFKLCGKSGQYNIEKKIKKLLTYGTKKREKYLDLRIFCATLRGGKENE